MTQQQQIAFLGVLLVVWGGVASWEFLFAPEPARVNMRNVSGVASGQGSTGGRSTSGLRVHLDLLTSNRAERAATFASVKNIFTLRRAVSSMSSPESEESGLLEDGEEVPTLSDEEINRQAAWAELSAFRYLGYVHLSHAQKAMALLAKNDVLHAVTDGETIDGRVLVKHLTPTEVTLQATNAEVEQSFSLVEH